MEAAGPEFSELFRSQLRDLVRWRRDVRRFRDEPLPPGALDRLLRDVATLSPSVGLSQPWHFVIVEDPQRRARVVENFEAANADALAGYAGDDARRYAGLKLSGLREAPVQVAAFADEATATGRGLGRATMPETVAYSVVAAVLTLWLLARAEGIGLGWVSIVDPQRLRDDLDVPSSWRLVAYLCIGYPEQESLTPELQQAQWETRLAPERFVTRR